MTSGLGNITMKIFLTVRLFRKKESIYTAVIVQLSMILTITQLSAALIKRRVNVIRKWSESMKTKKELMAEMEADKKVLDKYFVKTEIVDYDNICLLFRIFGPSKEILISVTQHYRPEIKPPALGIGVWGRHGGTFVSKGQFDSTGRLLCFDGCAILPWCSIVDPSHHSENWDEEWLPENLRNK